MSQSLQLQIATKLQLCPFTVIIEIYTTNNDSIYIYEVTASGKAFTAHALW